MIEAFLAAFFAFVPPAAAASPPCDYTASAPDKKCWDGAGRNRGGDKDRRGNDGGGGKGKGKK